MNAHAKPNFPTQIWSGGFWYGLAAAVLYVILMIALMCNLIGYIRGHYPQHFELTEDQRTLIIQTMFYIIEDYPFKKFPGGVSSLHLLQDGASNWFSTIARNAFDEHMNH